MSEVIASTGGANAAAKRWRICALLLLAAGLLTRFLGFGAHAEAAMDEIYFSQYISAYFTHRFYFDTHPPLGKLLVAAFASLWNFQPIALDVPWNASFSARDAQILRFLPTLAGALLPVAALALARAWGLSLRYASLAALLVLVDNALIAHSHFIYFDNFLLLSGIGALTLLLHALRKPHVAKFFGAGILLGMAYAVKWTALTFALIVALRMLWWLWTRAISFTAWCRYALATAAGMVAIYLAVFYVHFALLTLPGPGDSFMPPAFQRSLQAQARGEIAAPGAPGFLRNFVDTQIEMLRANERVGGEHPYGSRWWQWPLMWKPIYYLRIALSSDGSADSHTYSLGNAVVWWSAGLAMLITLLRIGPQIARRENDSTSTWLLVACLLSWLPFTGIARVMFLYHYFPALILSIVLLAHIAQQAQWRRRLLALEIFAVCVFLIAAPLTYGWAFDIRNLEASWLPSWR